MISKDFIGLELEPFSTTVEAGRLRFFARATDQQDPVYSDTAAARSAGYRDLPVPPTFLFGLELDAPNPFALFEKMGVDIARVLHGEQEFEYLEPACAGDELTFSTRVKDIFDKKGGALEFIIQETTITNQDDQHVANLRRVVVVRN